MGNTETADLYTGLTKPLLSFPQITALILISLPVAALIGFYVGKIEYRRNRYGIVRDQVPGSTALGGMLALLGLLLGFAFSSALNWREGRQSALVAEAAAIGTAFLTADLLSDPGRTELKQQILAYAKTRHASRSDLQSMETWNAFLERTLSAQARIWPATREAMADEPSGPIRVAVAKSVTVMMDAHTYRLAAAIEQIPPTAKLMIFLASVVSIFIVGNRSALLGQQLTWRTFVFAMLLAVVLIVIIDLDRSFEGTISINTDTMTATIRDMQAALDSPSQ